MKTYKLTQEQVDQLAKNIEKWPYYQVSSLLNWFEKNLVEVETQSKRKKEVSNGDHNARKS